MDDLKYRKRIHYFNNLQDLKNVTFANQSSAISANNDIGTNLSIFLKEVLMKSNGKIQK
jgi:hypothetical protein